MFSLSLAPIETFHFDLHFSISAMTTTGLKVRQMTHHHCPPWSPLIICYTHTHKLCEPRTVVTTHGNFSCIISGNDNDGCCQTGYYKQPQQTLIELDPPKSTNHDPWRWPMCLVLYPTVVMQYLPSTDNKPFAAGKNVRLKGYHNDGHGNKCMTCNWWLSARNSKYKNFWKKSDL